MRGHERSSRTRRFVYLVMPVKATPKMPQNQAAAWCTETDGQPLRSFFLRDNHNLILA